MPNEFVSIRNPNVVAFSEVTTPKSFTFHKVGESLSFEKLKKEHEAQLASVRQAAFNAGYTKAQKEAKAEYESRLMVLTNQLRSVEEYFHKEKDAISKKLRQTFCGYAWTLVGTFFDENTDELTNSLVKRIYTAVSNLISEPVMDIYLSPANLKLVREELKPDGKTFRLIPDTGIRAGSFHIKTKDAELNGDVKSFVDDFITREKEED
jgi:flagellar biosynthesis/type III secretory pathway protein FliH